MLAGVPLMHDDKVVGVLAVQSYSRDIMFNYRDQDLLTFVAIHIGSGLARKQAQDRLLQAHSSLEQRVSERTRELAEANAELVEQIGERLRAERKLIHQATHDVLTGLPNRVQLLERLARAISVAGSTSDVCLPCCSWTWTASSWSTTAWGTRLVMNCWSKSGGASWAACAAMMWCRAWAATDCRLRGLESGDGAGVG